MKRNIQYLMNKLRLGWCRLRTLTGDDAYERYLQHHGGTRSPLAPLSRKAYFRNAQQSRWDKINRCC